MHDVPNQLVAGTLLESEDSEYDVGNEVKALPYLAGGGICIVRAGRRAFRGVVPQIASSSSYPLCPSDI